jgi:HopA1 effector protein family
MSIFLQQFGAIVTDIAISADLTISHPLCPPLSLDPELQTRCTQIPPQLRTKFLTARVCKYLYDLYFTGSSSPQTADRSIRLAKNNLLHGVDLDFYRRLNLSNTSRGYFDLDWQIVAETEDGELIVSKDGLHLHVDRQQHIPPNFHTAKIGDTIPIYLPPELVGIDTYIVVGNLGLPQHEAPPLAGSRQLIRIYLNISPDGAVSLTQHLTGTLNKLGVRFQLAILHNPALCDRYDVATLSLSQTSYSAAQTYLAELYQSHQTEFSPQIPILTKQLAPGVGLAEVPLTNDSFGLHRCELIAEGLVSAFDRGQHAPTDRLDLIATAWDNAQLDRAHPYLNPRSSDCYDPW